MSVPANARSSEADDTTAARPATPTDGTRERILRAASKLFARKGYTGTSTREIARAVGVQQPSLFHHFASKAAILETLLAYSIDDAALTARRHADSPGSAAVRLYRFVVEDTAYLCGSPYDLSGVHVNEIEQDGDFAIWHRRLEELHDAIRDMVRQGIQAGEFVELDPRFAQEMISAMNIVNIRRYSGRAPASVEGVARASADFVLRALLVEASRLGAIADEAEAGA